jgi:hypothetical protein
VWSLFRINGKLRKRPDGPFRSEYIFGLLLDSSLMMGESSASDMEGDDVYFRARGEQKPTDISLSGFPYLGFVVVVSSSRWCRGVVVSW